MTLPQRRTRAAGLGAALVLVAILLTPLPAAAETIDLSGPWKFKGDWSESGIAEGWQEPKFDDSKWTELTVPGAWEEQGVTTPNPRWPSTEENDGYNGYAWYRRHITLPDTWAGRNARIRVGIVDDLDWVYVNGKLVGQTTHIEEYPGPIRDYQVPPGLLKAGDNVVAVRVSDTGGRGGIVEGPVELSWETAAAPGAPAPPPAPEAPRVYRAKRRDFVKVGGSVHGPADMEVDGDAVAIAGSVEVEGHVTGNAVAVGGSVILRDGAVVDGGATAVGGTVQRDDGATISGETVEVPVFPSDLLRRLLHGAAGPYDTRGFLGSLFSGLALSIFVVLLAALLLPQRMEVMARALPLNPGWAAFYGLAGVIVMPAVLAAMSVVALIAMVILLISVVGILAIPAVAVALAGAILAIIAIAILGVAAVWLSLGRAMLFRAGHLRWHTAWAMLLGMVVTYLLGRLPGVGMLVSITVIIFGFGIALFTGVGAHEEWASRRFGRGRRGPSPAAPPPPTPQSSSGNRVVVRSRAGREPEASGTQPEADASAPALPARDLGEAGEPGGGAGAPG